MDDWLEGVLQLLEDPVTLQDVDNAEEKEESLALVISSGNATGPEKKNLKLLKRNSWHLINDTVYVSLWFRMAFAPCLIG